MDTKYLKLVRKTGGHVALRSKYRDKIDLSVKNFTCYVPTSNMTMDKDGYVFICSCEGYLPYPVGHIFDFDSLYNVWNNPVAKKIQENTKSGSTFKFCNLKYCQTQYIPDPFNTFKFNIATDVSCNLQCPSCRNELMFYKSGKQFEDKKSYIEKFMSLLSEFNENAITEFAGGEPFASKIYSEIIYNYKPKQQHRFIIRSNATLIDQTKFETSTMLQSNIEEFSISIDAGTKGVYNIVRPPGKWETVLNNLQFLKDNNYAFHMSFVVQKNNFKDVINFINLCEKFEVDGRITAVEDWATWTASDWDDKYKILAGPELLKERIKNFKKQQVFMPDNELYNEWVKIYNNIIAHPHYINGNIVLSSPFLVPKK